MEQNTETNTGVVSCSVCEAADTSTQITLQKRGRGRPRKNPVTVATTSVATTNVVKRGRGRPRKNPVSI